MKVKKPKQVKGPAKSLKWKDVRGKRCRPPVSSSELNSSPVMARMAKEHHASVKKKPTVKRLRNKAKPVSEVKNNTPEIGVEKSHTQANGSSASMEFAMDNESNDSRDWKEYSESIQGNGVETSGDQDAVSRLEGESLHYCAERDDQQNHAVLVMQKHQVYLRILP